MEFPRKEKVNSVPYLLLACDVTLRRMGMIVDTSVGPAIFIVVGFVLKYM